MAQGNKTLQLEDFVQPDNLATQIVNNYDTWTSARRTNKAEKRELHNYLFATDTSKTSNKTLPWKNSTTIPKLTQLRDTLHANYMDALFPSEAFFDWEGDDEDSEKATKRETIKALMINKAQQSKFKDVCGDLVNDWIDEGNCFGTVDYVREQVLDAETEMEVSNYTGPILLRISPHDICFNAMSPTIRTAPKIVRSVLSLGDLALLIEEHPEEAYLAEAFNKAVSERHAIRSQLTSVNSGDFAKNEALMIEGFGTVWDYYASDYVEILTFYGNIYDMGTQTLKKDAIVGVMDRTTVIRDTNNPSWLRGSPIVHSGWRKRPDNLYAMGPLDNLVGLQYRIDHLENAKADAWDMFIHPVLKIKGDVEDFEYGPNERIYVGEDGDVEFMRPDPTALSADNQIQLLENKMEEMAGAPKQASGFRTPGEKTKFEVASLDSAASRLFLSKTRRFESDIIEPSLNMMLEISVRNMQQNETIRVVDEAANLVSFESITKEDITAKGKLVPKGAQHFATKAALLQNLNTFMSSPVGQDPSVKVHISGLRLAKLMERLLEVEKFFLVEENIRVIEGAETARVQQTAEQQVATEQQTEAGVTPDELFLDEEGGIDEELVSEDDLE